MKVSCRACGSAFHVDGGTVADLGERGFCPFCGDPISLPPVPRELADAGDVSSLMANAKPAQEPVGRTNALQAILDQLPDADAIALQGLAAEGYEDIVEATAGSAEDASTTAWEPIREALGEPVGDVSPPPPPAEAGADEAAEEQPADGEAAVAGTDPTAPVEEAELVGGLAELPDDFVSTQSKDDATDDEILLPFDLGLDDGSFGSDLPSSPAAGIPAPEPGPPVAERSEYEASLPSNEALGLLMTGGSQPKLIPEPPLDLFDEVDPSDLDNRHTNPVHLPAPPAPPGPPRPPELEPEPELELDIAPSAGLGPPATLDATVDDVSGPTDQWILRQDGDDGPPLSRADILKGIRYGQLGPDDEVRRAAGGPWLALADVKSFRRYVQTFAKGGKGDGKRPFWKRFL